MNFRNIDALSFREFCEYLTEELQKRDECANDDPDSCIKLKDMEDSNENLNRTTPHGKKHYSLFYYHFFKYLLFTSLFREITISHHKT